MEVKEPSGVRQQKDWIMNPSTKYLITKIYRYVFT
jgi:hypothetical protein